MSQLEQFWEHFAAEHWEQRPLVFDNPLGEQLISAGRAFECSVQACERWRQRQRTSLRFFVEAGLLQCNPDRYLPRRADADFQGYARRIAPQLRDQGFAFVLNGAAQYDFDVFLRARRFLRGLYQRVGMPADVTDMDIFVGNYRHTPFGVHTDRASNFSFVLSGRKRFLVWPWPALSTRFELHRSVDFEAVRSQAEVLEAEAGQVVYWPSSYWHIAESDGDLSAVLNVALYLEDTRHAFVAAAIQEPRALAGAELAALPWDARAQGGNELPGPLQQALEAVSQPPALAPDLHAAVLRAWLSRTSAGNFHRSYPAAVEAAALRREMSVAGDPEFPILTRHHGSLLLCAAHGHVLDVPALPVVSGLIERLNSGRVAPVLELIELAQAQREQGEPGTALNEEHVLLLLESLLAMRAIRVAA